jgi:hypothetical protein
MKSGLLKLLSLLTGLLGVVVVGSLVFGSSGGSSLPSKVLGEKIPGSGGSPVQLAAATPGFSISGSIGDLYPGAQTQLVLTVTNPYPMPILVQSLDSSVKDVVTNPPGEDCAATNLTIAPFAGPSFVVSERGGTATTAVAASLKLSAPDGCQDARWDLAYSGVATSANNLKTSTVLVPSANPSTPGQGVTFTATVSAPKGDPTPSGFVVFQDGTTTLGTVSVDANGTAKYPTSALSVGSHKITASYTSDSYYDPSSGSVTQQVKKAGK